MAKFHTILFFFPLQQAVHTRKVCVCFSHVVVLMLIVAQSYLFIIQFEISLFQTQYCTVLYPKKVQKKNPI